MHLLDEIALVPAPLRQDREARRWYADGGETCIALLRRRKLLEPLPTFGSSCSVLLATSVQVREANRYALTHGYTHARTVPRRGR